jgi:hypothetical protein
MLSSSEVISLVLDTAADWPAFGLACLSQEQVQSHLDQGWLIQVLANGRRPWSNCHRSRIGLIS